MLRLVVLAALAMGATALASAQPKALEYVVFASHESDDALVTHGTMSARLVLLPTCAADGLARNVTFLFEEVELHPPVPELEQALLRAHAWAVFAADGRLARVGGLLGASQDARDAVTSILSQWQWAVPAGAGITVDRRERDGAHTHRATYRHLGVQDGGMVLAKARTYTSVAHHHHQHRAQAPMDSRVTRTGRTLLRLSADGATLLSLSSNDTTEVRLQMPDALRGALGAGAHLVHSSFRADLLAAREPAAAELAVLGGPEACERTARVLEGANVEGMMRDAHVQSKEGEAPAPSVLLEALWEQPRAHHVLRHTHHDDIFPRGSFTPEQLAQLGLAPAPAAERRPLHMSLLETEAAAAAASGAAAKLGGAEVFAAMLEATATVHGLVHTLAYTGDVGQWADDVVTAGMTAMAHAHGLLEGEGKLSEAENERLPIHVHDVLAPFGFDSDDTLLMTSRYVSAVVTLLRGGTPSSDGLSMQRAGKLKQLFELTRGVASDMADQFGGIGELEKFEGKVAALVAALEDVVLAVNDLHDAVLEEDADVGEEDASGSAEGGERSQATRKLMIERAVAAVSTPEGARRVGGEALAGADTVVAAARAAALAATDAVDHAKKLEATWSSVVAKLASLLNIQLYSKTLSKSFGSPEFVRSTFVMEASLSVSGSKHQGTEHKFNAGDYLPDAKSGSADDNDGSLMEEIKRLRANMQARIAMEMTGFGQSGEVLALALEPKASLQKGFHDYKPKLRILSVGVPLTVRKAALAEALAKAVVHKFIIKLITSDMVQRFVIGRATKLIRRSLQRQDSIMSAPMYGRPTPGTLPHSIARVGSLLRVSCLDGSPQAGQLEAAAMTGTMVARGFGRFRAVASNLGMISVLVVNSVGGLLTAGDALYVQQVADALGRMEADLAVLAGETAAAVSDGAAAGAASTTGRLRELLDSHRERRKPEFQKLLDVLAKVQRVVGQVSAQEMQTGLQQLRAGAEVDAATALILSELCRLAGRECALEAGPLSDEAVAALGDTAQLYAIVSSSMELAVHQMDMLMYAAAAVGESVHARISPRKIVDDNAFQAAADAMKRVAAGVQALADAMPGASRASEFAREEASFLTGRAVADFEEKQELVRCTVGLTHTFIKSVVHHVQRAHNLPGGVCNLVGYLDKIKPEIDNTGCLGYLQGKSQPLPRPHDKPPATPLEAELVEEKFAFLRLYRGIMVSRAAVQLLSSGCAVLGELTKTVDAYSGGAGEDEAEASALLEVEDRVAAANAALLEGGKWGTVHDASQKALGEVAAAMQAFGLDRNSSPMRVVGMIRTIFSRINNVVKWMGKFNSGPEARLERLAFLLVERLVVPTMGQPHVTSAVAVSLRAHVKEHLGLAWFTDATDGLPTLLTELQTYLSPAGVEYAPATKLVNTQTGFFVVRYAQKLAALATILGEAGPLLGEWRAGDQALDLATDRIRGALAHLLDMPTMAPHMELKESTRRQVEATLMQASEHMMEELLEWRTVAVDASVTPALNAVLRMLGSEEEAAACVSESGLFDGLAVRQLAQRGAPVLEAVNEATRAALETLASIRAILSATSADAEGSKTVATRNPPALLQASLRRLAQLPATFAAAQEAAGVQPAVAAPALAAVDKVVAAEAAEHEALSDAVKCSVSLTALAYRTLRKLTEEGGTDAVCLHASALASVLQFTSSPTCAAYIRALPDGALKRNMEVVLGLDGRPSLLEWQVSMVESVCEAVGLASALKDAAENDSGSAALAALASKEEAIANWGKILGRAVDATQVVLERAEEMHAFPLSVQARAKAAMVAMQAARPLVSTLFAANAALMVKVHRLANLQADSVLKCYGGAMPNAGSLASVPMYDADFTVFSTTIYLYVFAAPVYVRFGLLLNFHVRLESGRCDPPPPTDRPALNAPPPTLPYAAMAPVFEAALSAEVAAGVGVPFFNVELSVAVDVLGVGLPVQTDVSLEHGAMSMAVRPYLKAGGGKIKATAKLVIFSHTRTLYKWKGYRRTLAQFCWNAADHLFSPCIIKRARVHDPGARNPGNSAFRPSIHHKCHMCAPVSRARSWSYDCPLTPTRFDALAGMINLAEVLEAWQKPWRSKLSLLSGSRDLQALVLCGERFAEEEGEWVYRTYVRVRFLDRNREDEWFLLSARKSSRNGYKLEVEGRNVAPRDVQPLEALQHSEALLVAANDAVLAPARDRSLRMMLDAFTELPDAALAQLVDGSVQVVPEGGGSAEAGAVVVSTGDEEETPGGGGGAEDLEAQGAGAGGQPRGDCHPHGDSAVALQPAMDGADTPQQLAARGTRQCFQCNVLNGKLVCPRIGRRSALHAMVGEMADRAAEVCYGPRAKAVGLGQESWVLMCNERVEKGGQLTGILVASLVTGYEYHKFSLNPASPDKCDMKDVTESISTSEELSAFDRAVPKLHLEFDEQKQTLKLRQGQCLPRVRIDAGLRREDPSLGRGFLDEPVMAGRLADVEDTMTERTGACYECTHKAGKGVNCAAEHAGQAERKAVLGIREAGEQLKAAFAPSNALLEAVVRRGRDMSPLAAAMLPQGFFSSKGDAALYACDEFLAFNKLGQPSTVGGAMCVRRGLDRVCFRYVAPFQALASAQPEQGLIVSVMDHKKQHDHGILFLFDKTLLADQHDGRKRAAAGNGQFLEQRCFSAPAGVPF